MELGGEGKRQTTFLSVLETLVVCLEKEMAIHFSIIAWRSPWTGKPGRLQSVNGVVGSRTRLRNLAHTHLTLLVHLVSVSDLLVGLYMRHRWRMLRIPNGILRLLAKCFVF